MKVLNVFALYELKKFKIVFIVYIYNVIVRINIQSSFIALWRCCCGVFLITTLKTWIVVIFYWASLWTLLSIFLIIRGQIYRFTNNARFRLINAFKERKVIQICVFNTLSFLSDLRSDVIKFLSTIKFLNSFLEAF